jgi:hypothetical protein
MPDDSGDGTSHGSAAKQKPHKAATATKRISTTESNDTQETEVAENEQEADDTEENEEQEDEAPIIMSEKGKRVFLTWAILTSPLTIALSVIIAAAFVAMYVAVLLFSASLVLVEIAGVIGGVLLGVGSVLYGIVGMLPGQIPSFVGQYELGFGIMLIGIVTVAAVLIYLYIMKVTPLALKGVTWLLKQTVRKIVKLIKHFRRECGKL